MHAHEHVAMEIGGVVETHMPMLVALVMHDLMLKVLFTHTCTCIHACNTVALRFAYFRCMCPRNIRTKQQ